MIYHKGLTKDYKRLMDHLNHNFITPQKSREEKDYIAYCRERSFLVNKRKTKFPTSKKA